MEAPEKIYLQDSMSTDTIGELWPEWFDAKVSDNSIEYTRTDAFIKKACLWLKDNIDRYLYNTGGIDEYIPKCGGKMIEDFKNYIKG